MSMKGRVLVVDDEASIRESLEMFLREKGLRVAVAADGEKGLALWERFRPQVVVLDIRLPDISGLEVLKRICALDREVKVIMITAFHDMETTIEAMRQGAYDYIHKPLDVDELDQSLTRALCIAEAARKARPMLGEDDAPASADQRIVGRSPAMRDIFKTIGLLARNRATVLIEGETGTGKELIARVIHRASELAQEPFVTVDCTTLVDNLLESELFGYERGAFTGAVQAKPGRLELAGQGTIFFDEVGDLPLSLQAKLLRFLEYRQFTRLGGTRILRSQARIIAATNADLEELTRRGRFRQDLLFRLKVINIRVPPLRQRLEDLPLLVQHFLARINQELNTRVTRVEERALSALESHAWPGNVRELKNLLTKAALESHGPVLMAETIQRLLAGTARDLPDAAGLQTLDQVEREHIIKAMTHTGWNLSAAARALGLSRPTLRKRLKRYGLEGPGQRS